MQALDNLDVSYTEASRTKPEKRTGFFYGLLLMPERAHRINP